jgi:hypothetical protein
LLLLLLEVQDWELFFVAHLLLLSCDECFLTIVGLHVDFAMIATVYGISGWTYCQFSCNAHHAESMLRYFKPD